MLRVERLHKFYGPHGVGPRARHVVHAVDGIDVAIDASETLGLVGESGSGKSTAGRCILRLEEPTAGRVVLDGVDVTAASANALRRLRPRMQMVYQDPYDSLNPRLPVGAQIAEPIWLNGLASRAQAGARVRALLEQVGLSPDVAGRYPHQLSGGQQQRVAIARALAPEPRLLVLDEPTASLDVSIQAQIMQLLVEIQARRQLGYLLISHDLPLVSALAQHVAVMYLGQIVETGPVDDIFHRPAHPYTRALLSATPRDAPGQEKRRILLRGEVTSAIDPLDTCRLYPRCPFAMPRCVSRPAALVPFAPKRAVRCLRFLDEQRGGTWDPGSIETPPPPRA
ncbi:MAG TPA: ABC transporter ATP-binding protein [bacterium]|nr:ABC transporter ATP-binding protein [bacterium]